jgi:hypothetical protein
VKARELKEMSEAELRQKDKEITEEIPACHRAVGEYFAATPGAQRLGPGEDPSSGEGNRRGEIQMREEE